MITERSSAKLVEVADGAEQRLPGGVERLGVAASCPRLVEIISM